MCASYPTIARRLTPQLFDLKLAFPPKVVETIHQGLICLISGHWQSRAYKTCGFLQFPRILNIIPWELAIVLPSEACSLSSTTHEYDSSISSSFGIFAGVEVLLEGCRAFFSPNNRYMIIAWQIKRKTNYLNILNHLLWINRGCTIFVTTQKKKQSWNIYSIKRFEKMEDVWRGYL